MKIECFKIKRYKSIEEITIPIQTYGKGKNKTSVAILVGLNESGKSSILEAINLSFVGFENLDYDDYHYKGAPDDDDIRVITYFKIDDQSYYIEKLMERIEIDTELGDQIKIESVRKHSYRDAEDHGCSYGNSINSNIPFYKYIVVQENGAQTIKSLKEFNKVEEEITSKNAKEFLSDGQELLTKAELERIISSNLTEIYDAECPKIQSWKPKPEFLINEKISLERFKGDTSISIPLRNIFHIAGFDTDEEIENEINKALKKPENKAELQVNLSDSITNYINKIWKEHKINIKVYIDGSDCSVHIEDKDRVHKYLRMNQRSDGFNQFISLILSLSTGNDTNELEDTLILLDEPEIHLHPSGVRYMRDEILKIGKNNNIIVATHSHYMVDTSTPERHFIVKKQELSSMMNQISESTSMDDDQVLASAFGLNLFKELLPQNILVVEGGEDKTIISYCLELLHKGFFYSIKSAGGASKVYSIASILADEEIPAFFIFDDDKEGRDNKRDILQNLKEDHDKNHVLTIRDILDEIPEKSTLEDLLPRKFVKDFFEREMKHEFEFTDDVPIIYQIKNQNPNLKENKEQLNAKKVKLAEEFVSEYSTKTKLEAGAPELIKMINNLVAKIKG